MPLSNRQTNIFRRKRQTYRFLGLASLALILLLIAIIPVRLAIALYQAPIPQAILTLGGGSDREKFTAQFAKSHPSLEIWVSTGTPPDKARAIFQAAGIPDTRVHLDRRAIDTVTNFTSLVNDFKNRNFQHLYLITSDYHMPRAKAIATIVLGSQGIAFTPVSIPSNHSPESWLHILRDIGRAFVWLITGRTGASLNYCFPCHEVFCQIVDTICRYRCFHHYRNYPPTRFWIRPSCAAASFRIVGQTSCLPFLIDKYISHFEASTRETLGFAQLVVGGNL